MYTLPLDSHEQALVKIQSLNVRLSVTSPVFYEKYRKGLVGLAKRRCPRHSSMAAGGGQAADSLLLVFDYTLCPSLASQPSAVQFIHREKNNEKSNIYRKRLHLSY